MTNPATAIMNQPKAACREKAGRARQYSKSYKKLVKIVEKMSKLNMEILKNSES